MRKITTSKKYLKILIGIVVFLWIIYFIQMLIASKNKNKDKNKGKNKNKKEGFTPRIRGLYRPYVRTMNQGFESFVNNYGPNVIMNKLRKWNIY
jgi:hypothetical protein